MLWLQYKKMVEIALSFLKAERTGDWQLHLDMCRQMLPYFASSGHYLYFKSAYLYLQTMYQLPMTHPNLYEHFQRRSSTVDMTRKLLSRKLGIVLKMIVRGWGTEVVD